MKAKLDRARSRKESNCGGSESRAKEPVLMTEGRSGNRRGRLHRLSRRAASAVQRPRRRRPRQHECLLRSGAEGGAASRSLQNPIACASSSSILPIATAWQRCSSEHRFPMWCISRRRPASAIRWQNPFAYVDANLTGFTTCSKAAGTMAAGICSTRRRRRSTAPTRRCRSQCMTTSTIRSAFMRRRRKPTS